MPQEKYSENMLKGRMAETLVEELLRKSGNTVYRFGYEAILQNLSQFKEKFDRYSEVGEQIRAIPDLVVIDKEGKPVLIEVKFRKDVYLHLYAKEYAALEKIKKYWGSKIIFVNCREKPYFRVSNSPYVGVNKELRLDPLTKEKAWKINPSVYQEFENLVEKYLSPILWPETKAKKSAKN